MYNNIPSRQPRYRKASLRQLYMIQIEATQNKVALILFREHSVDAEFVLSSSTRLPGVS